jgi:hypothetical protein
MSSGKDSTEVVRFLTLYSRLKDWCDDDASRHRPRLLVPLRYFEAHRLKPEWPAFLDDFQQHWPTNDDNTYVDFNAGGRQRPRPCAKLIPPSRGTRQQKKRIHELACL